MENVNYLGGKAEISIGNVLIPAEMLENVAPNFVEGTREVTSLAGVIKRPSGSFTTAEVTGTLLIPSMDTLKVLWMEAYEFGENNDLSGRVEFNGLSCATTEPLPVNVHFVSEENRNNDVRINAAAGTYCPVQVFQWLLYYEDITIERRYDRTATPRFLRVRKMVVRSQP